MTHDTDDTRDTHEADAPARTGTRWGRAGLVGGLAMGVLTAFASLTWNQALGFDSTVKIQGADASFSTSRLVADDAGFGVGPVRLGTGTWKNVLRTGFAVASLDGLCVSRTENLGPFKVTIKLTSGDSTAGTTETKAASAAFDLTKLRGNSINLQGSTQLGLAATDVTTLPGKAPYEANPLGIPNTFAGGFFNPDGTGGQVYSSSGNGGLPNGQGYTAIDATRSALSNAYGSLWQAQINGDITLPNLSINVYPFKDDIGISATGTQTTTPDGLDDRSCESLARLGSFPQ